MPVNHGVWSSQLSCHGEFLLFDALGVSFTSKPRSEKKQTLDTKCVINHLQEFSLMSELQTEQDLKQNLKIILPFQQRIEFHSPRPIPFIGKCSKGKTGRFLGNLNLERFSILNCNWNEKCFESENISKVKDFSLRLDDTKRREDSIKDCQLDILDYCVHPWRCCNLVPTEVRRKRGVLACSWQRTHLLAAGSRQELAKNNSGEKTPFMQFFSAYSSGSGYDMKVLARGSQYLENCVMQ